MRQMLVVLAVLVVVSSVPAFSQIQQFSWECSVSGAFSSYTSEARTSNQLTLLLRPGFFVLEGLEIEPEVLWRAGTGEPPSFSLSGNAAYNYFIPGSRVALFALAGYGVGNGIPSLGAMTGRDSDAFDITVLNAGGGIKFFASKAVAVRAEYRFQRFARAVKSGNTTTNYTFDYNNAFIGVSFFIP